jgi:hypothetical protein
MKTLAILIVLLTFVLVGCVYVASRGTYIHSKTISGSNRVIDIEITPK